MLLVASLSHAQTVTLQTGSSANQYKTENLTFGQTLEKKPATLGAGNYKESSNGASFWVYCLDPLTSLGNPLTYTKLTGSGNAALSTFISSPVVANSVTSYTEQFGKGGDYATVSSSAVATANKYDEQASGTAGNTRVLNKVTELFNYAYADATLTGSSTKSAAFQFALWEVLGDTKAGASAGTWASYNAASGGLREGTKLGGATAILDAGLRTQINTYLTALNTGNWAGIGTGTASNYTFTVFNSASSQTLVSVTQTAIPEPGSLALAGLALFGVVYTRRQGKAKTS